VSRAAGVENGAPAISVVVPVHNEAENLPSLVDEIAAAFIGREDL
jgi:glycosyltransferase involved in cell wall biosynthesis